MRAYPSIGLQAPDFLLPRRGVEMSRWAVIACDQYTSEPAYWKKTADLVGSSPSTMNMILPEVHLGKGGEDQLIQRTQTAMREYLEQGLLQPFQGLVLVERVLGSRVRRGLLAALDLEQYDFNTGSQSLIRATEGTILDRLPPRIRIRAGAPLELPHILVLIDDPGRTVIEPLLSSSGGMQKLYDFELMQESGHLRGSLIQDPTSESRVVAALEKLAEQAGFQEKYAVGKDKGVLLFAVGDGNHSLATAKSIWEERKFLLGMDHPSRYALVEIENLHDPALEFEPIHRVLFNTPDSFSKDVLAHFGSRLQLTPCANRSQLVEHVAAESASRQAFGVIAPASLAVASIADPSSNLAVGSLQAFLDPWLKEHPSTRIDFVHGDETVFSIGRQAGNSGFYLPAMKKDQLFRTVILDGTLPRKTFSMGAASEKRFYVEARRITS